MIWRVSNFLFYDHSGFSFFAAGRPETQILHQMRGENRVYNLWDGGQLLWRAEAPGLQPLRLLRARNEASSCLGIFSRTPRFYYVATSPGSSVCCLVFIKVGLGISRTNADSQWNPVNIAFHHQFLCCGNEKIRQ